ncbi:MAG: hypothetical protein IIW14_02270 [Kiritimatiellae bacterium]|jgi:uncharacterized protein YlxP (DUF503 family)|nr:hypothetical protein [Kiritimatiellia bacterium]
MSHVNWEALKSEYMTTETSLRKLARKYDVSISRMEKVSSQEKWVEARRDYRQQIIEKALSENRTREVDRLTRLMNTTEKAVDVVTKAFEDPAQFNRYLVKKTERYADPPEDSETGQLVMRQWEEEEIFNKLDTKSLKEATTVLKDLTGMLREFYDIPTAAQKEARRIAAERLELDRRKHLAAENRTAAVEIVLDAGEEAWNA